MTSWRPPPTRQDEAKRDNAGKEEGTDSQPVSVAAIREQPAADPSARPRSFAGTIKQLFREVNKAIAGKAPAPHATKRRCKGDTQGGFRLAVKQILRRVQRSIYDPAYFLCQPPDEMDEAQRLHLWHQNDAAEMGEHAKQPGKRIFPRKRGVPLRTARPSFHASLILLGIDMSEEEPLTHDAWQSHWRNGRFVKWVIQGEGRIDIDRAGNAVAHVYYFGTARGENGHTILMPKGMTPPSPQSQPKRPPHSDGEEDL